MKIEIQKTGMYHYSVFARRWIFFVQKIGTATVSLDGNRINLIMNPKWWGHARSIGEHLDREYLQQVDKQSS